MKKLLVFLLCTTSLFAAEPAGIVPRSDGSQTLGTSSLRYSDVHIKYGVDCATITVSGGIPESQIQPYKVSLSTGVMGSAIDTACRLSSATVSIANNEKTGIPATDGNVFTWDASSGMPVWNAPAAGGAAAVYPDITIRASQFLIRGQGNNATTPPLEFQLNESSMVVISLRLPNSALPNDGVAQFRVPVSWTDSETYWYMTFTSTGETSATPVNAWLDVEISSQPFLAASYSVSQSTTTFGKVVINGGYDMATATGTYASGGSVLLAGKSAWVSVKRRSGDPAVHEVRMIDLAFSKTKLW